MKNNNFYYKDGKTFIRVTNICAIPEKFGLHPWMINCALNYVAQELEKSTSYEAEIGQILDYAKTEHKRQADHAMFIGQTVHHFIHDFTTGQESQGLDLMDIPEVYNAYQAHLQWREDFRIETVASEITVYHDKLGYAGTIDEIAWIRPPKKKEAKLYIVDHKVSSRLYPDQMVMQLAAYKKAFDLGLMSVELGDLEVEGIANVRLDKEKIKYQWQEYSKKEEQLGWIMFECLLNFWKLKKAFGKEKKKL